MGPFDVTRRQLILWAVFLAGLLLSETEFRHQVETDIEPFKGLLLGLFFISIGMQINFGVLALYYGSMIVDWYKGRRS